MSELESQHPLSTDIVGLEIGYDVEITNDKVFVGVPQERVGLNEFYSSRDQVLAVLQAVDALADNAYHVQSHRVDVNRDRITESFLEHPEKPDWLLMLDSDMDHPPTCALRLRNWRKPIVGALYFHRDSGRDHDPMAFKFWRYEPDENGVPVPHWLPVRASVYGFLRAANAPFRTGSFVLKEQPAEALLPVDGIGTGCMMIHRSVFEKMEKPYWEYRFRQGSEDLDFCKRASELGIQSYVDLSTVCGHYALTPVGHPHFMNVFRNRGINQTTYDENEAVFMLKEFAGMEDADKRMAEYDVHELGRIWEKLNVKTGEEAKAYYTRDDVGEQYLLDLMWWNSTPMFSMIRSQLVGQEGKHILEIGSGIGTVTIQMALQGNAVTGVEINPALRDFAEKRFNYLKRGDTQFLYSPETVGPVKWLDDLPKTKELFDVIVTIDVLEHLPGKALREMLAYISDHLPINGRLCYHNTWSKGAYPMHYDHSKHWEKWAIDVGLFPLSEYWLVKVK